MTVETPHSSIEDGNTPKRHESILKVISRSFFSSFFKGAGFILAFLLLIALLPALLNTPSPTQNTTLEVLPNQYWTAKAYSPNADTLLQISIHGPIGIARGVTKADVFDILTDLHNLDLKPGNLKGIILNINSPGGAVDDSDAIYRIVKELKKNLNIPVFAYVDGECCSGGMLIALAADKIIASEPSAIGHVGVIMGTAFNYYATMQRLGIEAMTIHAGKMKDELNPFRPWKMDEGAPFQSLIDQYYNRFINLVAENRPKLTVESLKEQGAQAYLAPQALELGYIDEINNSWIDALGKIAQETGCSPSYQLIELKPNTSFTELLFSGSEAIRKGHIEHQVRLPGDIPPEMVGKPLYYRLP